jgi:hypothetical protein
MTREKVHELEIKVAVIETKVDTIQLDITGVKSLLKWFMVLSIMIIGLFAVNFITSYGDDKLIKETVIHNSKVIGEMAAQAIEQGLYKPSEDVYREGQLTNNDDD